MSELQKLLTSTGSSRPVDGKAPGMSAGIAECNPTPQPQASTNEHGTILSCSFYGCKQNFSNIQQLSTHIESHQIPTQSLPGKAFHCSALGCNGTFPSMQHLMEHMRHHYKPNHYFLCESCRAKLRSYRALFKHLHTCAKVAKSKAAREEMTSPGATAMTEVPESAPYDGTAPGGLPADAQTPIKEEPMELEPVPTTAESVPATPLACLQATVNSLPPETPQALPTSPSSPPAPAAAPAPPPGSFSLSEPTTFPAEPLQPGPPPGSFIPSTTPSSSSSSSPLPYPPPVSSTSPPAPPGQRPGRPVAPASPAPPTPPGSNAVWKKNQDTPGPLLLRRNSHPSSQSISAGEAQGSLSAAASSGSTPGGATVASSAATPPLLGRR
ncbi:zinc finger protein 414-like isoform X2 [Conger conger]|uniref:zinc finger protein 414-like isoform X2 n=1 Tax=Conger conger TaxID=82655 RepID=UPI002A5A7EA2|nr:zinc finger protein 414-like isoform X2 [Conger conger]